MSDKNLCDETYFQAFYKKHARDLYSFLYYKCGNPDVASDLLQESFIKVYENCSNINFDKARSYLFTTAGNLFLNKMKHDKVKLNYQKNNSLQDKDQENPEFILEEKEYMQKLENAIGDLTDAQREVFLLNRIDKKKYREIAEMIGISEKAVEKRMMGALKALRKTIGEI